MDGGVPVDEGHERKVLHPLPGTALVLDRRCVENALRKPVSGINVGHRRGSPLLLFALFGALLLAVGGGGPSAKRNVGLLLPDGARAGQRRTAQPQRRAPVPGERRVLVLRGRRVSLKQGSNLLQPARRACSGSGRRGGGGDWREQWSGWRLQVLRHLRRACSGSGRRGDWREQWPGWRLQVLRHLRDCRELLAASHLSVVRRSLVLVCSTRAANSEGGARRQRRVAVTILLQVGYVHPRSAKR